MSTKQKTLKAFLATARAALTGPPSKRPVPLHFVVGNESADLDSLCSALFLAYFWSHTPPHTLHVPLCHLPREDLALRPEFSEALRRAAVTPDDVLTLSELFKADGLKAEDTRWLLVDHNVLTGELEKYGKQVVGCVDHHDDEGKVPEDAEPRVIQKTGSCMSLVVEECRGTWNSLAEEGKEEALQINAQLAYLALASILIDTANLGNKNKTTTHDEQAVELAESRVSADTSAGEDTYDRKKFYDGLSALKEDVSGMSFRDIFRKDYKEWDEGSLKLGTSSVPQSFAYLVRKAGDEAAFVRELGKWGEEKGLDLVAILTTSKESGEFKRELLVWARTGPEVVKAAKKFSESDGRDKLGLGTWADGKLDLEDGKKEWRKCWTQERIENSRKQIAPMLRDALKGVNA
ncbi:DHH phosphoesterase [Hypoxylon trugodes]|uniref:DHH phosphoesterase n=1 Tax=Hypoxylon trugodes TaxID=326681 RepID=UPI002195E4E6|nr:DHH phosphoesterase [Hypoxylon trugodes]KAI1386402.1 DHH phosphoesterase [Hypoxylon trugodes]